MSSSNFDTVCEFLRQSVANKGLDMSAISNIITNMLTIKYEKNLIHGTLKTIK